MQICSVVYLHHFREQSTVVIRELFLIIKLLKQIQKIFRRNHPIVDEEDIRTSKHCSSVETLNYSIKSGRFVRADGRTNAPVVTRTNTSGRLLNECRADDRWQAVERGTENRRVFCSPLRYPIDTQRPLDSTAIGQSAEADTAPSAARPRDKRVRRYIGHRLSVKLRGYLPGFAKERQIRC